MNEHWIDKLFASIDHKNAAEFVSRLTPDARFHYGNAPPVVGRGPIRESVAAFFDAIDAVSHQRHRHWSLPHTEIVTGEVCYTRRDRSTLVVPFCNVLSLRGDLIEDYRIYVDNSQLFT